MQNPYMPRGEIDYQAVGRRIRDLRGDTTQEKFADAYNVSRQAISKWENGDQRPGVDNCIKIALDYDVRLDWFLWGIPPKEASEMPLDERRLLVMAAVVERELQAAGVELSPDTHARAILRAYNLGDPKRVASDLRSGIPYTSRPRGSSEEN